MNTVEDKYENLKKLWWFIMEDNIKIRRKLALMKAKLAVLERSGAGAFHGVGDVSPDVDDHITFSDAGC